MNPKNYLHKKTIALICFGLFLILAGFYSLYIENKLWTSGEYKQTACPLLAKICPDGSSVTATGPRCEFAECPSPQKINQTVFNADRDLLAFNMGDSIILYWADLPSSTKSLVFYRSESKNGPWLKVLSLPITDSLPEQDVVDSITGDKTHWYRAEALASDGTILKLYGILEVPKYVEDDSSYIIKENKPTQNFSVFQDSLNNPKRSISSAVPMPLNSIGACSIAKQACGATMCNTVEKVEVIKKYFPGFEWEVDVNPVCGPTSVFINESQKQVICFCAYE